MEKSFIENLPKIDLHCHLDGSVPAETLTFLAQKDGLADFQASAAFAPEKCLDLADYLQCFDAILPLLQTVENLELATFAVIEALAAEQVAYAELRFAPLLHRHKGLSIKEVIEAVCAGVARARATTRPSRMPNF